MNKEKYYLTTAIAYTSGKPHIGNSYEIVMADAIANTDQGKSLQRTEYSIQRKNMEDTASLVFWRMLERFKG